MSKTNYDYIIVGAGAAGCVLAARLSEDSNNTVLLLEAGNKDWSPLISAPGGLLPLMLSGSYAWHYQSLEQPHLANRSLYLPRGKVLGGSSSTNGMVYDRGVASDYDEWAALGNEGWSYSEVLPYFRKAENYQPHRDQWHGATGPIQVSRTGVNHPFARAFVEAGQQAGHAYNNDTNGAQREGFGPTDVMVGKGRRSSSSKAYLRPIRHRSNLTILTERHVNKVLFDGLRASGVDVAYGDKHETFHANKEILLCGGAINSPQLLMLSGVGDEQQLRAVGVTPVVNLPGVGKNMQDHLAVTVKFASTKPISLFKYLNPLRGAWALLQYLTCRSGPLSDPGMEAVAYLKSSSELHDPDIKFLLLMALYKDHGRELTPQHGFGVHINVVKPDSVGELMLQNSDPKTAPLINQNYLSAPRDRAVLRQGIRYAREVFLQSAFDAFRGEELAPGTSVVTDDQLDEYIKTNADADYHSCGTCKMGLDAEAVVDNELRVRGVSGLRVVDASIMPRLVSGNTCMPTIMIAEKAADLIAGKPAPFSVRKNL